MKEQSSSNPKENEQFSWIKTHAPADWQALMNNTESALTKLALNTVQQKKPQTGIEVNNLAGTLPIHNANEVFGALVLAGDPINAEECMHWDSLLQICSGAAEAWNPSKPEPTPEKELAALKVITAVQQANYNVQEIMLHTMRGIRQIFEADDVVLFLLDEKNPELVIKRQLGNDDGWEYQYSCNIEPGMIQDCVQKNQCFAHDNIQAVEWFNHNFDGIRKPTKSYLCSPISSNGASFGAVAIINPPANLLGEHHQNLLTMMTGALANAIHSSRLFMQLKVSNADLEASRWELLNSRNTLRALFDSLPASIYIIEPSYTIAAINKSCSLRKGEHPTMMVGRKCYEKLYKRTSPCPACQVSETFSTGENTNRIGREWLDLEMYVEWDISTYPIYNGSTKPAQVIITEYDVTERRNLEADLIQSEKLAAVGQLAASVAHEINNPLTAIIANAQMLQRDIPKDDEDLLESVNLIETAGNRASQVVRNLLSIARKETYDYGEIDLNQTIESALSLVYHEITRRPIRIEKDLQENIPLIFASKDHLHSVWINLLLNALDSIDKEEGQISITSRYTNGEFRVTVSDNGQGISQEKMSRIFEPFFTTKVAGRGTGLGLSLCMRVVKQHGGSILVESQPGKGAAFSVILPVSSHP
jgi:two-component system, NtrC family, sensor kinase